MKSTSLFSRFVSLAFLLAGLVGVISRATAQSSFVTPYAVSTHAGVRNSSGSEDGHARSALVGTVGGVAYGADGTLYFTDREQHTVRKLSPSGVVSLVAGRAGTSGLVNSGGNAARFNSPQGLAIDADGNLFVADTGNRVIRRVTPAGVVSTYAGSGVSGTADAAAGNAHSAQFRAPVALVFDDAGNLFVSDTSADTVRRVRPNGQVETVVAAGVMSNPTSLAVAQDGTLYIADRSEHVIRVRRPSGLLEVLAGAAGQSGSADGVATEARFSLPSSLVLIDDTLLVADYSNRSLRRIALASGLVTTMAGDAGWASPVAGTPTSFDNPRHIALAPDRTLAVACFSDLNVLAVPEAGPASRVLGASLNLDHYADGEDLQGLPARIGEIGGIAVSADGTIYFTDSFKDVVRRIRPDGFVETLAGLAGARDSNIVNGTGSEARFQNPKGVVLDASGNLYVADHGNDAIRKITPEGVVTTFATGFMQIDNLVFNPADGSFFVADYGLNQILRVSSAGAVSVYAGTGESGLVAGPAHLAQFTDPSALAQADDGTLYVSDRAGVGHVIWKISPGGLVSLFAGSTTESSVLDASGTNARFGNVGNLAMGPDGNIYASELSAGVLRRITPAGVVTSLAGGGNGYVDATGGAARISEIEGLAVDTEGRIYFGDTIGNTLRVAVPATSVPSFASATSASGYAGEPFAYQALASAGASVAGAYPLPPGLTFNPATGLLSGEALAAGTYTVTFRIANEITETFANVDLTLAPARQIAQINLAGLAAAYDGTPRTVTATTNPAGLSVTIRYEGSATAPTAIGSYAVSAIIDTTTHRGLATGTLVIGKGAATVGLTGLAQIYDGDSHAVTVTTEPAGLDVVVTYDEAAEPPSGAGSYAVVATVDDANYAGSASGTLVIGKGRAAVVLGGLDRVYNGAPIVPTVSTSPSGLNVVLTYDGGATAPVDAGSYTVRAVVSDPNLSGEAEAVLRVAKAPLTVRAADRSRFVGQAMPALALRYEGFVGDDGEADLSPDRPLAATAATATSPVGEYAITVSGGSDANYDYVRVPGVLRVSLAAGTYEALLRDEDDLPRGWISVTVPRAGFGYTGRIVLAEESRPVVLNSASRAAGALRAHGPLTPAVDAESGRSSASGLWRRTEGAALPALELMLTLSDDGALGGVLTRGGQAYATLEQGRRLRAGKTGAPGAGAYTLRLTPPARHPAAADDVRPLPEGAGHATAKIDGAGRLSFTGMLPDGTPWTGAALQDDSEAYHVYLKPHGTARLGNWLAGRVGLESNPLGANFRRVRSAELVWNKPAGAKDAGYRDGFGPLVLEGTLAVWRAPVADNRRTPQNEAVTLAHRLGLSPPGASPADVPVGLEFSGAALNDAQRASLPTERTLLAKNVFASVPRAENPSGLSLRVLLSTGAISGSVRVAVAAPTSLNPAATVLKTVKFSGVMIQPDGEEPAGFTLGSGVYVVPGATSSASVSAGEFRLVDQAAE